MMNRIQQAFTKKAYVGFLTGGDGGVEKSIEYALAMIEGGINIIELGVPFSDPVADGPVIQQAYVRALQHKTTINDVLKIAKGIRAKSEVAIVLFTYFNPLLQQGKSIYQQIQKAGIDGILVVDLPLEEASEHIKFLEHHQLQGIFLASPSTPIERLEAIDKTSKGFVYYACQKGTTGMQSELPSDFVESIVKIKSHVDLPVAVGFGIKDRASASTVLKYADGFVVGSYFVDMIGKKISTQQFIDAVKSLDPRGIS